MIDFTALENALFDWVVFISQLPEESVVWEAQGQPEIAHPSISLDISPLATLGRDWVQSEENGTEDVDRTQSGPREFFLQLQCRSSDALGEFSPRAILHRCITRSQRASATLILRAACCTFVDDGQVQTTSLPVSASVLEPRGLLTMRMRALSSDLETLERILKARVTSTIESVTRSVIIEP